MTQLMHRVRKILRPRTSGILAIAATAAILGLGPIAQAATKLDKKVETRERVDDRGRVEKQQKVDTRESVGDRQIDTRTRIETRVDDHGNVDRRERVEKNVDNVRRDDDRDHHDSLNI